MVYIGPVNTLSLTAKTKAASGYSPEKDMPVGKIVDRTIVNPPVQQDRRRQRDRRKQPREPVLETRQGVDRRQGAKQRIDVSV
jgi:hypothetical protein